MNLEFGRKINYWPLTNSFLVGVIFLAVALLLTVPLQICVLLGLGAFLLMSFGYYPLYLPLLYSFWRITDNKIDYIKMPTYISKLKLIFAPSSSQYETIDLNDIITVNTYTDKNQLVSGNILAFTAYAPELYMPWLRPAYYLEVKTKIGTEIHLDLSWDMAWGKAKRHEDAKAKIEKMKASLNIYDEK